MRKPHQRLLGNSSINIELPRNAAVSMAGPTPKGVALFRTQADYKDSEGTQILTFGVSS
ncbi:MAG: hypothetical protein J1F38_02225 [Muribaculaceae bacterium]|nr:hypothetical protein [Muribaculaceae bacterium]